MATIDRSTQRVIAVIALLVVVAWSLRGYVPGVVPLAEREQPRSSPVALAAVVAILSVAVAIIGFAVFARMRDRSPSPAAGALPRSPGSAGRSSWRFTLIALGAVIAWLVLMVVLTRLGEMMPGDEPLSDGVPQEAVPDAETGVETVPPPTEPEPESDAGPNVVDYLIPPMLVLMVVIVIGTAVASRRRRRSVEPYVPEERVEAAPSPRAADSLARAAEVGLAEIGDLSREPREAIIACYAAMERELTRVPGAMPQDCDTPTEVLARAVDSHALRADSATELVELFEEARFSPHVMSEAHRDTAVEILRRVLAELPGAVGSAR
jgi:hypothetical protein